MEFDANGERIPEISQQAPQFDANGERLSANKDSSLVEELRPVIKQMESGGRYDIYHPKTKSGKQALGAYGVVPEFWFNTFPELGLDSNKPEDKKKYIDTPALQDAMFTKIMSKGIQEVGTDPAKLRAWYYGGKAAVNKLGTPEGDKPQVAYKDGKEIAMPSINADAQKSAALLGEDAGNPAIYQGDSRNFLRELAGLPPLRYPNNPEASELYNNPEAQTAAVHKAKQAAISSEPLREQIGSGVGAFAYKMPGMGKLAELSGLAPAGSAANKTQEIQEYNSNRTGNQMVGELLPDVLASSLGGAGATELLAPKLEQLGQLGFKGAKALKYAMQGGIQGATSAGIHQAEHVGSGEKIDLKEATIETLASAGLGTLGGTIGDRLKALAPGALRRGVNPTMKEVNGANPINWEEPLKQDLIPTGLKSPFKNGLKESAESINSKLSDLQDAHAYEARKASLQPSEQGPTFVDPQKPELTPYTGPNPNEPPMSGMINLADLAENKPNLKTAMQDMIEANKSTPMPKEDWETPQKYTNPYTEKEPISVAPLSKAEKQAQLKLSTLADKAAIEKAQGVSKLRPRLSSEMTAKEAAQQASDEQLLQDALDADKSNRLQTKLKGQRGAITLPDAEAPKPNISDLKGDVSRKVNFVKEPMANARAKIEKEMASATDNKLTSKDWDKAKETLDTWEAEAKARPTAKGNDAEMTVEDGVSLRQAIDDKIKWHRNPTNNSPIDPGTQKALIVLRTELNKTLDKVAPEAGELRKAQAKLKPLANAINQRVTKNANGAWKVPASIKLASLAGGAGLGALSDKQNRTSGAVTGALMGLTLGQLATTPGGAAIMYKAGRSLADNTSVRRNTVNQLMRSLAVKSREK